METNTVLLLLTFIIKLMTTAENILGRGTGPKKKEIVMEGGKALVEGMTTFSTGGQKTWWQTFGNSIGNIVDLLAGVLFPHENEEEPPDPAEF